MTAFFEAIQKGWLFYFQNVNLFKSTPDKGFKGGKFLYNK